MIKLEEKDSQDVANFNFSICLSPFCFNNQNRVFSTSVEQHSSLYTHNKQQCQKWVISLFQLMKVSPPYKPKQFSSLELNFSAQPIATLRKIARLDKSDWKKQVTKQINAAKKQINAALDSMQERVMHRLQQVLESKKYLTEIQELITSFLGNIKLSNKQPAQEVSSTNKLSLPHQISSSSLSFPQSLSLTQSLNRFFLKNGEPLSQIKTVHFLKKLELKQQLAQIKKSIQSLEKKIIEEKNSIKSRAEERVKFYEWMFEKDDNIWNKLQMICSLIGSKPQNFNIKEQMIVLPCNLCQKYVKETIVSAGNLKQIKKFMTQQMIIHMYNEHHDKVFYSFLKKVSKPQKDQLDFEDILNKFQKYQQLHIVDRETGVMYTQDFVSNDIDAIDILTRKNAHLAKNNFIVIESKEAINSFVTILAYQAQLQKKKLIVVSNRFDHLTQISALMNWKNISVVKKYDGTQLMTLKESKVEPIQKTVKKCSN